MAPARPLGLRQYGSGAFAGSDDVPSAARRLRLRATRCTEPPALHLGGHGLAGFGRIQRVQPGGERIAHHRRGQRTGSGRVVPPLDLASLGGTVQGRGERFVERVAVARARAAGEAIVAPELGDRVHDEAPTAPRDRVFPQSCGRVGEEPGDGIQAKAALPHAAQPRPDVLLVPLQHRLEERVFAAEGVVQARAVEARALLEVADRNLLVAPFPEHVAHGAEGRFWIVGAGASHGVASCVDLLQRTVYYARHYGTSVAERSRSPEFRAPETRLDAGAHGAGVLHGFARRARR